MNLHSKVTLVTATFVVLLIVNLAEGGISVGVREGDWIEYEVTTTGAPPEEFNVVWSRMEILSVQETKIRANVTSRAPNGTLSNLIMTFDLERGRVGAWFIIPANLNPGDTFHDEFVDRNVTVEGEEQLTYAGAMRTITNATTPERLKRWDKSTGVFVECVDVFGDYSINATAIRTNMWGAQVFRLDTATFNAVVLVVATAVVAAVMLIAAGRRKK